MRFYVKVEPGLKKAIAVAALIMTLVSAAACNREEIQTVDGYEYNASTAAPQQDDGTTAEAKQEESFVSDSSWKKNYSVTYRYYNAENDTSSITAKEVLAENAFVVSYPETASSIYYKASGANTDMYTITPSEKTHTLLTGKSFSSLSSLFMKLSEIDRNLPQQSNVMYMGTESVADRPCLKYIQRAYTDGEVTETVYIWVDAQYGFGAKCQALGADNTLKLSWEVLSFESGELKESDTGISLSSYKFTEAG